jgi:hypothetical protein
MRTALRIGCFTAFLLSAHFAMAEDASPRPVPRMQVVPQPYDQASLQCDGLELTRYHFGASLHRPFLFPIIGPSGRSLSRIGQPSDPVGHSHHNSVWIAHNDVNGENFWSDGGKGRIVHRGIEEYVDADDAASLQSLNVWKGADGNTVMNERRRVTVEPLGGNDNTRGEWLMTIDLEFFVEKAPATFNKSAFGPLAVRMAHSIGVRDGGGRITNSEGAINEKAVFWKPARWCDYSGAITNDAVEGITIFDHPANPNHPTVYHVRDNGWMGTSLSFDGPRTIEVDKPLRLRYGLYVHRDLAPTDRIESQWKTFASKSLPTTLAIAKK